MCTNARKLKSMFSSNLDHELKLFFSFNKLFKIDEVRGMGCQLTEPYVLYGDEVAGPHNKEIRNFIRFIESRTQ